MHKTLTEAKADAVFRAFSERGYTPEQIFDFSQNLTDADFSELVDFSEIERDFAEEVEATKQELVAKAPQEPTPQETIPVTPATDPAEALAIRAKQNEAAKTLGFKDYSEFKEFAEVATETPEPQLKVKAPQEPEAPKAEAPEIDPSDAYQGNKLVDQLVEKFKGLPEQAKPMMLEDLKKSLSEDDLKYFIARAEGEDFGEDDYQDAILEQSNEVSPEDAGKLENAAGKTTLTQGTNIGEGTTIPNAEEVADEIRDEDYTEKLNTLAPDMEAPITKDSE